MTGVTLHCVKSLRLSYTGLYPQKGRRAPRTSDAPSMYSQDIIGGFGAVGFNCQGKGSFVKLKEFSKLENTTAGHHVTRLAETGEGALAVRTRERAC